MKLGYLAHLYPADTRAPTRRYERVERSDAELADMSPSERDRARGRTRRRLEDALERRRLARELGELPD